MEEAYKNKRIFVSLFNRASTHPARQFPALAEEQQDHFSQSEESFPQELEGTKHHCWELWAWKESIRSIGSFFIKQLNYSAQAVAELLF